MTTNTFPKNIGPHSDGPWRCWENHKGEFSISCESGGFAPIAKVKGDKRSTLKNAKANAHLISAAPDLLAALYAMVVNCHDLEHNDEIVQAVNLARKAIAKAEGV